MGKKNELQTHQIPSLLCNLLPGVLKEILTHKTKTKQTKLETMPRYVKHATPTSLFPNYHPIQSLY